jgi:16S rRNA processing protein RimM
VFESGRRVKIFSGRSGLEREAAIEFFRRQHGRCVIKLTGIDSVSDAEAWIGAELRIPVAELEPPPEGTFYTFQLKGCRVYAMDGEDLGTVSDVLDHGGVEILKVDRDDEETLIPFAREYLKKVDTDQRRIEVDLPEGLRGLNR